MDPNNMYPPNDNQNQNDADRQAQDNASYYQPPQYQPPQYSSDSQQNPYGTSDPYASQNSYQSGQQGGYDPNSYQAPQYQSSPYQSSPYSYQAEPLQTQGGSGLAIGSMVCGILSIVLCCGSWISWILSVVAIVLGAVSISKGRRGKGMAMAGIITGAVGIVLSILILIVAGIMGAAGDLAEYSHYFDYYY